MKLTVSRSANSETYYVQKSFRTESGKSSTKTVERLGSMKELIARFGAEDPIGAAKAYIRQLTEEEKEETRKVVISFSPTQRLKSGCQIKFNGGYLFLQKIYYDLGLDKICNKIEERHNNKYSLNDILSMLLYTRVMYPGSKLSSLEDSKKFVNGPKTELHDIYRALSLLSQESDYIQAQVYKNSLKLGKRTTRVLYYDCTNYFFESEEECGLRQYGCSKEHRPNPIVQMGLFMDMDGFPLAFCINPGNTNEQVTLKPLEKKLGEDFGLSKIVVCTDCGLSSLENRKNNSNSERSFITVQSLKKLKGYLQDWATDSSGWYINGSDTEYDLEEIDAADYYDTLFHKERWFKENGLEQRIIVTFSFKYRDYLEHIRERQIQRAERLLSQGKSRIEHNNANDPKRFIQHENCTADGELAQFTSYSLNYEMRDQEARFDGFYAICTDLEDSASDIIKANSGRWIIEDGFRIMKSEFDARPVFLQRDDRIKAHFLTCFLALLLYKYLEKGVNAYGEHYTVSEIITTLSDFDFTSVRGDGYMPIYTRTPLTDCLHSFAGFRTDYDIVAQERIRKIIAYTKKRRSAKGWSGE